MTTHDLYWAAGFLEGEGSFYFSRNMLRVSAAQVSREPLERLQRIFGGPIFGWRNKKYGKPSGQWCASPRLSAGVMMTLFVLMSPERKAQIQNALSAWKRYPTLGWHQRAKTHCPKGHPYDETNTVLLSRGKRGCRTCRHDDSKRRYAQRRESVHDGRYRDG